MTSALVTGGTGFVGRRLIERLVAEGRRVRALHRSPDAAAGLRALGAEPVQGDLSDPTSLGQAVRGQEAVFHAAALFTLWGSPEAFREANVEGTRRLLNAAASEGVARFIQIGAAGVVMGQPRAMRGVTEDAPLAFPRWAPYLASKAEAQRLVLAANGAMRTSVVMPPMIWGPGMPMLDEVARSLQAGRLAWPSGGRARIATAHVDNVVHAAFLAAQKAPGGRAYFVADEGTRTLRQVLTALLATRGVEARAPSVPFPLAWRLAALMEWSWQTFRRPGAPPLTRAMLRMVGRDFTLDDSRARRELGYRPVVAWEEGLAAITAPRRPTLAA